MLNDKDFSKLRKIIREEVEAEAKNTKDSFVSLEAKFVLTRHEILDAIAVLSGRIKNLEIKAGQSEKDHKIISKELQIMKKDLAKIDKKLDKSINFLDHDYVKLQKRVTLLEGKLKLPPPLEFLPGSIA